jgi:hypothetical protein
MKVIRKETIQKILLWDGLFIISNELSQGGVHQKIKWKN